MSSPCENYKETTPASGGGSVCVVMEEMIVLPKKELPEIVQCYKGELTSNALLNRAGHLAAKKKRFLADPSLDAAQAVQQTQPLSRMLREATKRLRQLPGAEGPGVAVDEEEEDENLVSTALEKWMKRMVQSALKREPKMPRPPHHHHPQPPPHARPSNVRPPPLLPPSRPRRPPPPRSRDPLPRKRRVSCAACWKRVCWQVIKVWTLRLEREDASIRPKDGKIGPKGENCVVHWPETIIEEEEETRWLWVGYPKMDQQEWAQVALARLSVHGTQHAFEETLATWGSGH